MALHFVVSPNCNVLSPGKDRLTFGPGTVLKIGKHGFSEKHMQEHMNSGFVREVRTEDDIVQTKIEQTDVVPGVEQGKTLDGKQESEVAVSIKTEDKTISTGPVQQVKDEKPDQETSIWTLDPAFLGSLDLDALNIMILERDSEVAPYETTDEAIAHLSQHYVAPAVA